ncbi:hypothetical protein K525DRAFT_260105, partial [Schizophyllum commune Loenen D]
MRYRVPADHHHGRCRARAAVAAAVTVIAHPSSPPRPVRSPVRFFCEAPSSLTPSSNELPCTYPTAPSLITFPLVSTRDTPAPARRSP